MVYKFRSYENGDEKKIIELFHSVFGRDMSHDFWRWRFLKCPFGKAMIYLAFENENLVGHYAVHPMDLSFENKIVKAVFSMTTMIHPLHQRKGLFSKLAFMTYEKAASMGYRLVYGFPNKNSHQGFVTNLGWEDMGKIRLLKIKSRNLGKFTPKLDFERIFGSSLIDHLTSNLKENYVMVPRTRSFIEWRFFLKPDDMYYVYTITKDNRCLLYFVLKQYGETAHVIDSLGVCDKNVIETMLSILKDFCDMRGLQEVTTWLNDRSEFCRQLIKYGFEVTESETYFGIRNLISNDTMRPALVPSSKWYLTMADSDVY